MGLYAIQDSFGTNIYIYIYMYMYIYIYIGVSKKTGEPEPEPENRKPGNQGPGSGLEKLKTGYLGSGTRFLPGYRELG
jgi:hypothetical protein